MQFKFGTIISTASPPPRIKNKIKSLGDKTIIY